MSTWFKLLLLAVVLIAGNVAGQRLWVGSQLDMTEDSLYTLSQSTKTTLQKLDRDVDVSLYFSSALNAISPEHGRLARQVDQLLQRYEEAAGGKMKYHRYDPKPFSELEDEVSAIGFQAIPLNNEGDLGYFGLTATAQADDGEIDGELIPLFDLERESFVEFDITRMLSSLVRQELPKIGVLSPMPLLSGVNADLSPRQGQTLFSQLGQYFDMVELKRDDFGISVNFSAVIVAQPGDLTERQIYGLDQYLAAGGRALIFADPVTENSQSFNGRGVVEDLWEKMQTQLGVTMSRQFVVGDPKAARQVNAPDSRGNNRMVRFLPWLVLRGDNFNADSAFAEGLSVLSFGSVGTIEGEGFTPIVTASEGAGFIPAKMLHRAPNPAVIVRAFEPSSEPLVIAATGKRAVSSLFGLQPPPTVLNHGDETGVARDQKVEALSAAHISESQSDAQLVLVADTDLLFDRFWISRRQMMGQSVINPIADNGNFVATILENLAGGDTLADLRARERVERPLTRLNNIQARSDAAFRSKEQALLQQITGIQEQMRGVQGAEDLGDTERAKINAFNDQLKESRLELRTVKRDLAKDLNRARTGVVAFNLVLVPLLVALFAFVHLWRRRQRSQSAASP